MLVLAVILVFFDQFTKCCQQSLLNKLDVDHDTLHPFFIYQIIKQIHIQDCF